MDFQAIINQVASIVEDTSATADTDIRNMINNAYREVWQYGFWPELETEYTASSVDGTREHPFTDFGATLGKIKAVYYKGENDTRNRKLVKIRNYSNYLMRDLDSKGNPTRWVQYNNKLYLWLTPNYSGSDNIIVLGKAKVDDLADNQDTPFFDSMYHHMLVNGGAWKFFDKDDDTRAQLYERYFMRDMAKMFGEKIGVPDDDEPLSVQFGEDENDSVAYG